MTSTKDRKRKQIKDKTIICEMNSKQSLNQNNNYSDILRLRSHEFYNTVYNSRETNNNSNQRPQQDRHVVPFPSETSGNSARITAAFGHQWIQMTPNFQPIFRSNSSLSLDQKRVQNSIQNSNSIDFKDFQELRECRFTTSTTTATTTTTTASTESSAKASTKSSSSSPSKTKSRTIGPNSVITSCQKSLSISNENLNKIERKVTQKSKTKSLFFSSKKQLNNDNNSTTQTTHNDSLGNGCAENSLLAEEMERRRRLRQLFIHYDIQSALSLDELFDTKTTTTTTAQPSTTSNSSSNSLDSLSLISVNNDSNNESESEDSFETQFNSNSLLTFSPNFKNEIGKELVYCLQLTGIENSENDTREQTTTADGTQRRERTNGTNCRRRRPIHAPTLSRQLSCLSSFDMSSDAQQSALLSCHQIACPFDKEFDYSLENCLERDFGFNYYRKYFYGFSHQNWFLVTNCGENKTSIALSLRKDSKDLKKFRLILRTNHSLKQLKGFLNLNQLTTNPNANATTNPNPRDSTNSKEQEMHLRAIFELLLPKSLTRSGGVLSEFRLGFDSKSDELLLKFDEILENNFFKIGILYSRDSQSTEEDFYNNKEIADKDFDQFLSIIGTRVRLKGYKGFRGGLDVTTDTTGLYAFATQYQNNEIIYHVMNELPFSPNNRQQLLRKRHIGNDIVTIVFQSKHFRGKPFNPALIRSHFQHVFIVVRPHHNGYRVAIARHKDVPPFGPPLKSFYRSEELRDFLLTKVINAENACHKCAKFKQMALRTRFEYLNDLFQNYTTPTTIQAFMASNTSSLVTSSSTQQLIQFSQNFNKYFSQIFPKRETKSSNLEKNKSNQTLSSKLNQSSEQLSSIMSSETKNIFLENELFFGSKLYESIDDIMTTVEELSVVCGGAGSRRPSLPLKPASNPSFVVKSRLFCHSFQQSLDIKRVKIILNQNFLLISDSKRVLFSLNLEQIIGFLLTNCETKQQNPRVLTQKSTKNWNSIEIQFKIYFHFGELLLLKELMEITSQHVGGEHALDSESCDACIEKHSILFELKSDLMTKIRENNRTSSDLRSKDNSMRFKQIKETILRRNPLSMDSSFGFHVQSKQINNCPQNVCVFVTEVNEHALRVNDLRRGQRLLELCSLPLISLTYENVLDFLKTSQSVSVALVHPLSDATPRINGCFDPKCHQIITNQSSIVSKTISKFNQKELLSRSEEKSKQNQKLNYLTNDYENIQTVTTPQTTPNRQQHNSPIAQSFSLLSLSSAERLSTTPTRQPTTHVLNSNTTYGTPTHHNNNSQTARAQHRASPTTQAIPQTTTSHSQRPLHVVKQQTQSSSHYANQTSAVVPHNHVISSSQSSTTSSTLQEDLIKLITLNDCDVEDEEEEEVEEEEEFIEIQNQTDSHSSSRYSTATSTPYSSLERRHSSTTGAAVVADDCVVTVAKPAFVVQSVNEFGFGARRQLTLDDTINSNVCPLVAEVLAIEDIDGTDDELEWPSLVVSNNTNNNNSSTTTPTRPTGVVSAPAVVVATGADPNNDFQLKRQVKELSKEKLRLNETIRQLKEENQRLHFESQTASQQLRKFTEWFFSSNSSNNQNNN